MPELPEVQVVVNYLKTKILNKNIDKVNVLNNKFIKNVDIDFFVKTLANSFIKNIYRIGKYLVFDLSNEFTMVVHLRMEGKFFVNEQTKKHDYIIFEFKDKTKLAYNDSRQFGTFHLVKTNELTKLNEINKIGPDPLNKNISIDNIYKKICKSNKAIKTILLDQTIISGIGNIYANEILFESKINPFTKGTKLNKSDVELIFIKAKEILNKAISYGGTTIHSFSFGNNKIGSYSSLLKVHLRENQYCYDCKNKIKRATINGRSSYYCDCCQKIK